MLDSIILGMYVLGMTSHYIWWWGSCSETVRSVEYLLVAIIPRSTLTQNGSNCKDAISGSTDGIFNSYYHFGGGARGVMVINTSSNPGRGGLHFT